MSDSEEEEGILLIDESEDVPKKTKKRILSSRKSKRIKSPKVVQKSPRRQRVKKDSKQHKDKLGEPKPEETKVRTSKRQRKVARKHSPPPIVGKLKVKLPKRNVSVKIVNAKTKSKTRSKAPIRKKENAPSLEVDVDIERVSDDEITDFLYSSTVVNENSPVSVGNEKSSTKRKKKGRIKLKLSLGKVFNSPKISVEDHQNSAKINDPGESNLSPEILKDDSMQLKPLIISKKFCSSEFVKVTEVQVEALQSSQEKLEHTSPVSKDHKPLTLRLSMAKPVVDGQPNERIKQSCCVKTPKPFLNIKRRWSITPAKIDSNVENTAVNTPQINEYSETPVLVQTDNSIVIKSTSDIQTDSSENRANSPGLFINSGLQSLLDAVSVELNNENIQTDLTEKTSSDMPSKDVAKPIHCAQMDSSNVHSDTKPIETVCNANAVVPSCWTNEFLPVKNDGQLPSMSFPRPEIKFITKKRSRSKSSTALSALIHSKDTVEPSATSIDVFENKDNSDLTEKEKRRLNKRKALNPDFVDPDTLLEVEDGELLRKRPKKQPILDFTATVNNKTLGSSLLMPQVWMSQKAEKNLTVGSTTALPTKTSINRKPKKGMATAKQRLANKLKLGKGLF